MNFKISLEITLGAIIYFVVVCKIVIHLMVDIGNPASISPMITFDFIHKYPRRIWTGECPFKEIIINFE